MAAVTTAGLIAAATFATAKSGGECALATAGWDAAAGAAAGTAVARHAEVRRVSLRPPALPAERR